MELLAANIKEEPLEEEEEEEEQGPGLDPAAIKQEVQQTDAFSIKTELPELEEAALEDYPEVSCVHIKEESLDIEPTYIHRVFPDEELFCMTGHGVSMADGRCQDGDGGPAVDTFRIPHSFFLSDPLSPDQRGCGPLLLGDGVGDAHSRGGTPRHFTIRADGFTPRMKFPCPRSEPDHKPYRCAACGKAFRRMDHLRRHQSMHSGEKPYRCGSCDKRFSLRRSQEAHQRRCQGAESCSCPVCGDVFQSFSNLQQHRRIHDGEKSYQCSRCGRNDKQSNYYREHHRVHCDDQPYLCPRCEER